MRYVRYLCIAIFAVALISVALANRQLVQLQMLPRDLPFSFAVNPAIEMPLFLVILGSIIVGLLIGFVWEWFREYGIRQEGAKQAREKRRLEREVARLMDEKHQGKDEVLAILDKAG